VSAIELISVSKFYGRQVALNDVSLSVDEGDRLVVMGPSGCGKSTLLRLIAGLAAPDQGKILLSGKGVSEAGRVVEPPEARNLGMVFQDLALWSHLSVRGNLEFGLKARGIPQEERSKRIEATLGLVGLDVRPDARPGELSGGQQQRVALARALVLEPKILLMDEPLSSLDLELSLRLRREIVRLQERLGFTLVYVTHGHDEAAEIGRRAAVMDLGRIRWFGAASEARGYLRGLSDGTVAK
jgi:iron(III) transport system ATP-binding protein